MAGRIQHDPPSSGPRLFIGPAGPQPDGLRFGCVQIVIVVYRHHLGAEKRRPERRETSRVVAIKADLPQASQCHDATLTPAPHGKAWTFRLRRDSASRMPDEPAAEEAA